MKLDHHFVADGERRSRKAIAEALKRRAPKQTDPMPLPTSLYQRLVQWLANHLAFRRQLRAELEKRSPPGGLYVRPPLGKGPLN